MTPNFSFGGGALGLGLDNTKEQTMYVCQHVDIDIFLSTPLFYNKNIFYNNNQGYDVKPRLIFIFIFI